MTPASELWLDPTDVSALAGDLCRPELAAAWGVDPTAHLVSAIRAGLDAFAARPDVVALVRHAITEGLVVREADEALVSELVGRALAWRVGGEVRPCWELLAACAPHLDVVPPLLSVLLGRCDPEALVDLAQHAGLAARDPIAARDVLYRALRNADGLRVLLQRLPRRVHSLLFVLADRYGRPLRPSDHPALAEDLAQARRMGLVLGYPDVDSEAVTVAVEVGVALNEVRRERLQLRVRAATRVPSQPAALQDGGDAHAVALLRGPFDPTRATAGAPFGMAPAMVLLARLTAALGPQPVPSHVGAAEAAFAGDLADRAAGWMSRLQRQLLEHLAELPEAWVAFDALVDLCCDIAASVAADGYADLRPLGGHPLCWHSASALLANPPREQAAAHVAAVLEVLETAGLAAVDGLRVAIRTVPLRDALPGVVASFAPGAPPRRGRRTGTPRGRSHSPGPGCQGGAPTRRSPAAAWPPA